MSDVSQGEGWWLASDRKWYPPTSLPAPPPPPVGTPSSPNRTAEQTTASPGEHKETRAEYLARINSTTLSAPAGRSRTSRPSKSAQMVCPPCHTKGRVTTKAVKAKKGVSGGKATAAVITGGWSVFATGLSRKEKLTEARCGHCGATWHF